METWILEEVLKIEGVVNPVAAAKFTVVIGAIGNGTPIYWSSVADLGQTLERLCREMAAPLTHVD